MSAPVLGAPVRVWKCPSCGLTDRTQRPDVHTQFHDCPRMGGLDVPLEEVQSPLDQCVARHRVVEREDYVGDENPIMAVHLDRPDGTGDVTVYPMTARVSIQGKDA